jgi:predicted transposase/invertase (TIGR01784 family)
MKKQPTNAIRKKSSANKKESPKIESNQYDKIIKENLKPLLKPLLRRVLGLKFLKMKFLPVTKQQTTLEREPDFICLIYSQEYPNGIIIHIEFQTDGDPQMADRILEYVGIERRRYRLPVLPFVICIGEDRPFISNEICENGLHFTFPVHYLCDEPYHDFIQSNNPEEVILAILANFEGKTPEEIISMILNRLYELRANSPLLNRFLIQLRIISKLRKLQPQTLNLIENMALQFQYKIEEDLLFIRGEEKGRLKGELRGEQKGKLEGKLESAFNMFDLNFESQLIAGILDLSLDAILAFRSSWELRQKIKNLMADGKKSIVQIAKKLDISKEEVQRLIDLKK